MKAVPGEDLAEVGGFGCGQHIEALLLEHVYVTWHTDNT